MIAQKTIVLALAVVSCVSTAAQQAARFEYAAPWPDAENASKDVPAMQAAPNQVPGGNSPRDDATKAGPSNVQTLKIFVLQGDRAINSIRSRSATAPVVEVRDERNLPIEGAEVVFQLPAMGPGGYFSGQKLTWTGRTDANGQAIPAGFSPNQQAGRFAIRVTATHGGRGGRTVIAQTNSLKAAAVEGLRGPKRSGWWKPVAVLAAGGAAGGIIWATRGGSDRTTLVLHPGTISFGGPR